MKKTDAYISKIFLFGLPVVAVMALIASWVEQKQYEGDALLNAYHSFSGIIFGLWMLFSLYLCLRLIFASEFRAHMLPRLAFFKERDERELLITAQAARSSFLTTLALLLFFLCLSAFQVAVYRVPKDLAVNGKTGTISLGVNMNLVGQSPIHGLEKAAVDLFSYSGLPLSNFAAILFLLLWQIGSYNYFAQRLRSENIAFPGV